MTDKEFDQLDEKLKDMPKPKLDEEKSQRIYSELLKVKDEEKPRKRKMKPASRWGISLAGIAALVLLMFLAFSYFGLPGGQHPMSEKQSASKNKQMAPRTAVQKWAEGVKERDGKKQFELFSFELQNKYKQQFEKMHWLTGTATPWVKSYEVFGKDSNTEYKVVFHVDSSTGDTEDLVALVFMEKESGKWVISKVESSADDLSYNLTNSQDTLNQDDLKLIKSFRSKQNYSQEELTYLDIKFLGEIDQFRLYDVPSKDEGQKSWERFGYVFPKEAQARILGIEDGKLYTLGNLIFESSINIRELYYAMPKDFQTDELTLRKTPADVVNHWAEGVQKRDGQEQFYMLSPDLQKKYVDQFKEWHWSPGVSSPWVKSYSITEDNANHVYHITFVMNSSGVIDMHATVHLEQIYGQWYITEVTSDAKEFFNLNVNARG